MDRLPNFQNISNGLVALSEEISLCANLAGVQNAQVLEEIRQGFNRIDEKLDTVSARVDTLSTRVGRLSERVDTLSNDVRTLTLRTAAINANTLARLANSHVTRPNQPLQTLRALNTNEIIPRFPTTLNAVDAMTSRQIIPILEALEQPIPEGVSEQRQLLKQTMGLMSQLMWQ